MRTDIKCRKNAHHRTAHPIHPHHLPKRHIKSMRCVYIGSTWTTGPPAPTNSLSCFICFIMDASKLAIALNPWVGNYGKSFNIEYFITLQRKLSVSKKRNVSKISSEQLDAIFNYGERTEIAETHQEIEHENCMEERNHCALKFCLLAGSIVSPIRT